MNKKMRTGLQLLQRGFLALSEGMAELEAAMDKNLAVPAPVPPAPSVDQPKQAVARTPLASQPGVPKTAGLEANTIGKQIEFAFPEEPDWVVGAIPMKNILTKTPSQPIGQFIRYNDEQVQATRDLIVQLHVKHMQEYKNPPTREYLARAVCRAAGWRFNRTVKTRLNNCIYQMKLAFVDNRKWSKRRGKTAKAVK